MSNLFTNAGFDLVVFSILFVGSLAILVGRMKKQQLIHRAFFVLLVCLLIWAMGALILLMDSLQGRPIKVWAVNLAYVGLILTPVAALYVGLIYARTTLKLSPIHLLSLVIPLFSLILLFTNGQHHLFYRYYQYDQLTQAAALGPYFIFHTIYSYLCVFTGTIFLAYFSIKNAGFFSRQSIFILSGVILSFGFNILVTFQIIDSGFHNTVIVFSLSNILFYLAIIKYDFLAIVPIALQRVVDHISDSFLVFDQTDTLIDYNKTFVDAFDREIPIARKVSLDELTQSVKKNESLYKLLRNFKTVIGHHNRINIEQSLIVEGKTRHYSIEVTPLFNQERFMGTIVLLKDITEIREAVESLQRNHEILMEKERLASLGQLIGGIAHNLKTPIMSISGGIEGLKDLIDEYVDSIGDHSVTPQDHREIAREMMNWIEKIKPHCTYMNDIITTVKGQAAQFNTTEEMAFTLDELIHRVDLLMKHELKRYHCILNVRYLTSNLIEMKGEINSLVQIFDNLIINSLQSYNGQQGQVDMTIQEQDNQILFELRDYGAGISEIVREKLFKEMVTTKGKLGTGLGLYMSHATIRGKFGGRMWFESESGQGTTFFISLPVARSYPNPALVNPAYNGVINYAQT
jgi:two-component system sensor histidine kinase HupT/HoxJ